MIRFRNPIQIQFRNDDFGIKRMVFKFVVAGVVLGAAVATGVWMAV